MTEIFLKKQYGLIFPLKKRRVPRELLGRYWRKEIERQNWKQIVQIQIRVDQICRHPSYQHELLSLTTFFKMFLLFKNSYWSCFKIIINKNFNDKLDITFI